MVDSAPRIPQRLVEALARVDDGKVPIAEVCRRIGALAGQFGYARPSYERVRVLVHEARAQRRPLGPSAAQVLWEGSVGLRSYGNVMDNLARSRGERLPRPK